MNEKTVLVGDVLFVIEIRGNIFGLDGIERMRACQLIDDIRRAFDAAVPIKQQELDAITPADKVAYGGWYPSEKLT